MTLNVIRFEIFLVFSSAKKRFTLKIAKNNNETYIQWKNAVVQDHRQTIMLSQLTEKELLKTTISVTELDILSANSPYMLLRSRTPGFLLKHHCGLHTTFNERIELDDQF